MRTAVLLIVLLSVLVSPVRGVNEVQFGDGSRYWRGTSLVLAEILDVKPFDVGGHTFVFRPIGTVAGRMDASTISRVRRLQYIGEGNFVVMSPPWAKGQTVLVVLSERRGDSAEVSCSSVVYVYDSRQSIEAVAVLDSQFEATLAAVQQRRTDKHGIEEFMTPAELEELDTLDQRRRREAGVYWSTRGVVFATIAETRGQREHAPAAVVLRPKLTFAGAFDAGLTPEVTVPADFGGFGPSKPLAAGDKVLVVLQRDGRSYRVAQECPAYMPEAAGRRAPICVVKDFADPRVAELVKALKAARKAERDAEQGRKKRTGPPVK